MKKGFTLVELLVTISILGILMGLVVTVLNPASFRAKARDGRRQSDLQVVQSAIEMYYAQNSVYPSGTSADALNIVLGASGGGAWAVGGVTYLSRTPKDPQTPPQPSYCYAPAGSGYFICAQMEGSSTLWVSGSCSSRTYNFCLQNTY
ncbi:MAG: prepilin-type N-terminal cleavage/methylation domain-containing protein [Patescibacteria group bacterium]